jgi:hypothetical protein
MEDGSIISVVVDPDLEEAKPAGDLEKIEPKLKDSIDKIGRILPDIEKSMKEMQKKVSADEINLEFGIALNSNGSIIIASAGIQASFNISVTWSSNGKGAKDG